MADQSRMSAYGPQRIDPADKAQLAESPVRWQRIARLLDHHPELRRRMAALNQTCRAG